MNICKLISVTPARLLKGGSQMYQYYESMFSGAGKGGKAVAPPNVEKDGLRNSSNTTRAC